MTAPYLAAQRFGIACLLGCILGIWYGFLRPLRPRRTGFADMLFLVGAYLVWLELGFGVCHGDLRLGYASGLFLGGIVWESTAGKLLRPLYSLFWHGIGKIWCFSYMLLSNPQNSIKSKEKPHFHSAVYLLVGVCLH